MTRAEAPPCASAQAAPTVPARATRACQPFAASNTGQLFFIQDGRVGVPGPLIESFAVTGLAVGHGDDQTFTATRRVQGQQGTAAQNLVVGMRGQHHQACGVWQPVCERFWPT